jgi:hypothetical protein
MAEQFILIPKSLWDNFYSTGHVENDTLQTTKKSHIESSLNDVIEISDNIVDNILNQIKGSQNSSAQREIVESISDNPRTNFSETQTIILDGTDTGVAALSFLKSLTNYSKKELPKLYYTLLSVLKLPSGIVKSRHALATTHGDWIPAFR